MIPMIMFLTTSPTHTLTRQTLEPAQSPTPPHQYLYQGKEGRDLRIEFLSDQFDTQPH